MDTFAGPSFHSARWPDDLDLTGKRFALVGAGASGFQIAPTIADEVEQLTIYQRTAQWMLPNPLYHAPVPPGDRWAMRHLPFYARWFRFLMTYPGIAIGTDPYRIDPDFDEHRGIAINETNDPRRQQLTRGSRCTSRAGPTSSRSRSPTTRRWASASCRTTARGCAPSRSRTSSWCARGIERIVPDGVVTVDGVHHDADVICYATGFRHNDFLASMDVTGRNGVSLRDQWGDEPTAYLGITIPNFPNLFCVYGPGTNLAHGASLFFHSECQIHYAMDCIHHVLASGARHIEVRKDAHDEYAERYRSEIDQLVWAHPSIKHSHYKNPQGKIFTLSPWRLELYWEWTRAADPEQQYLVG